MRVSVVAGALAFLAAAVSALPAMPGEAALARRNVSSTDCDRDCMSAIVDDILDSLVAHDPYSLPLAQVYKATENSHPAALGMMTLWRTVTKACRPNLLAIDTLNGTAYFALDISEGNDAVPSVLWARIRVVGREITELELYVNRSRGDHGFSFSPEELPDNYRRWMSPPADRVRATRAELQSLSAATFDPNSTFAVNISSDCQFTEEGWTVVDPGPDGNGSTTPLACSWPDIRPSDTRARQNLVIDEKYGIVVTGALIPGIVYPYANISAFIPDALSSAQEAQEVWYEEKLAEGGLSLVAPTAATGENLQVLQYYNGELQGQQFMIYLSGPRNESAWVS